MIIEAKLALAAAAFLMLKSGLASGSQAPAKSATAINPASQGSNKTSGKLVVGAPDLSGAGKPTVSDSLVFGGSGSSEGGGGGYSSSSGNGVSSGASAGTESSGAPSGVGLTFGNVVGLIGLAPGPVGLVGRVAGGINNMFGNTNVVSQETARAMVEAEDAAKQAFTISEINAGKAAEAEAQAEAMQAAQEAFTTSEHQAVNQLAASGQVSADSLSYGSFGDYSGGTIDAGAAGLTGDTSGGFSGTVGIGNSYGGSFGGEFGGGFGFGGIGDYGGATDSGAGASSGADSGAASGSDYGGW